MNMRELLQERYGKGHLSYSSLKHALTDMRKFDLYMRGELHKESDALHFGSLYDCMLLTPDLFGDRYVVIYQEDVLEACSKETRESKRPTTTKEYKQVVEMLSNGKEIVKESEYNQALEMIERLQREGLVDTYLQGGEAQVEFNLDLGDVPLRGFLDYLHDDFILDSKTIGSTTDKFQWDVRSWDYDVQAYIYMQVFPRDVFYWLIQEKKPPFYPAIVTCSEQTLFNGEMKVDTALQNIKDWLSTEPSEQRGYGQFEV